MPKAVGMQVTDVTGCTPPHASEHRRGTERKKDLLGSARVATGRHDRSKHGHDESFHHEASPDVVVCDDGASTRPRRCGEDSPPSIAHRWSLLAPQFRWRPLSPPLAGGISVDMRDETRSVSPRWRIRRQRAGRSNPAARRRRLRPEGVCILRRPGAVPTSAEWSHGGHPARHGPLRRMREKRHRLTVIDRPGRVVRTHSRGSQSVRRLRLTAIDDRLGGTLGLI